MASLGVCAIAFGFFYLSFPGGMHFGITLGNFLAAYECAFVAFHEANFHEAAYLPSIISLTLPVLGFLSGCFCGGRILRTQSRVGGFASRNACHV